MYYNRSKKYTPIEDVLNIYEPRYWYYIPGFNGYEISNDSLIRSMKHKFKYPYGILIKPIKEKSNSQDLLFELSNNDNERKKIRLSEIIHLAQTNPYVVSGYPKPTYIGDGNPRNDRHFVKKKQVPVLDNTRFMPKFTVREDPMQQTLDKIQRTPEVRVPIISIKGDIYYGREDRRTFSDSDVQK